MKGSGRLYEVYLRYRFFCYRLLCCWHPSLPRSVQISNFMASINPALQSDPQNWGVAYLYSVLCLKQSTACVSAVVHSYMLYCRSCCLLLESTRVRRNHSSSGLSSQEQKKTLFNVFYMFKCLFQVSDNLISIFQPAIKTQHAMLRSSSECFLFNASAPWNNEWFMPTPANCHENVLQCIAKSFNVADAVCLHHKGE